MKLLIITQKVDIDDDVLGFFHEWIRRLAEHFEKIVVICLQKGKYKLPDNVRVLSLGKEKLEVKNWKLEIFKKLKYLFNFFRYIWQERKNYDVVFVHMNQIYVILGGWLWRIWGKKILFWRNHPRGNFLTRIAVFLANKVFYTSDFSFTVRYRKAEKMPAGIDTKIFRRKEQLSREKNSILFLGRISPIKNLDVLIGAIKILDSQGVDFILNIIGEAPEKDKKYFSSIRKTIRNLEKKGKVRFFGGISFLETPEIYNRNEIFVNLTTSGSFDKTVLEAMACETLPIVSNRNFLEILPDFLIFKELNATDLAKKMVSVLKQPREEFNKIAKKLRLFVVKNHSLDNLVNNIKKFFNRI